MLQVLTVFAANLAQKGLLGRRSWAVRLLPSCPCRAGCRTAAGGGRSPAGEQQPWARRASASILHFQTHSLPHFVKNKLEFGLSEPPDSLPTTRYKYQTAIYERGIYMAFPSRCRSPRQAKHPSEGRNITGAGALPSGTLLSWAQGVDGVVRAGGCPADDGCKEGKALGVLHPALAMLLTSSCGAWGWMGSKADAWSPWPHVHSPMHWVWQCHRCNSA